MKINKTNIYIQKFSILHTAILHSGIKFLRHAAYTRT